MNQPLTRGPRNDVSRVLEIATRLFRLTLPKCLPLAMMAMLCVEVPNLYWIASGRHLDNNVPMDPTYWLLSFMAAAVTLYFVSAMMLQQRSLIAREPAGTLRVLQAAAQRLPFLLVTWLLAQLSLLVGFLLLVLPCVFLFVCYLVMLPVALFENTNPYMVLVRCVLLVRPHWWRTLATLVIAALVVFVCVVAFTATMAVISALLTATVFRAIATACTIAFLAAVLVFLSALALTIHSAAASSSA